jgi:hypothetical protein
MKRLLSGPLFGVCALALAASVAACGGGGGGGSTTPPTGGGTTPPSGGSSSSPKSSSSPTASPSASATPTASAQGQLSINGSSVNNAKVTYTCGCNQGAGLISTNASGSYTLTSTAPLAPSGTGTYTLQGHNVLVIGYAPGSATQAWTMDFVGNSPATDLNLSATDDAAAAASLYLFWEVAFNPTIKNSTDQSFDWFNYNQISAFVSHLRSSPDAAETQLLNDISAAQSSGTSLFPYNPSWNPTSDGTNSTISSDISAVVSGGTAADATLPTPCPAVDQCTGAPTP